MPAQRGKWSEIPGGDGSLGVGGVLEDRLTNPEVPMLRSLIGKLASSVVGTRTDVARSGGLETDRRHFVVRGRHFLDGGRFIDGGLQHIHADLLGIPFVVEHFLALVSHTLLRSTRWSWGRHIRGRREVCHG